MSPAVHLMNLTAESTYCYSISTTDSENDTVVAGSCNGTFTTGATSADGVNVAVVVGSVLGSVAIILFLIRLLAAVVGIYVWKKKNTKNDGMRDGQTPRDGQTETEMRQRSEDERNE